MKKVYILFNVDVEEVIAVSEDRGLIEEIAMDCFIDDVDYQWHWELQHANYTEEELPQRAQELWEDMMTWYTDYIVIFTQEVLE